MLKSLNYYLIFLSFLYCASYLNIDLKISFKITGFQTLFFLLFGQLNYIVTLLCLWFPIKKHLVTIIYDVTE